MGNQQWVLGSLQHWLWSTRSRSNVKLCTGIAGALERTNMLHKQVNNLHVTLTAISYQPATKQGANELILVIIFSS